MVAAAAEVDADDAAEAADAAAAESIIRGQAAFWESVQLCVPLEELLARLVADAAEDERKRDPFLEGWQAEEESDDVCLRRNVKRADLAGSRLLGTSSMIFLLRGGGQQMKVPNKKTKCDLPQAPQL